MGLSNDERLSKLYWGITHITQLATSINLKNAPYDQAEAIRQLRASADTLWNGFLGSHSNGAYWILGGDAGNPVRGPNGPWSAAIVSLCDEHRKDPSVIRTKDLLKDAPFDPFEGYLDIPGLLSNSEEYGGLRKTIYKIYGWTEFVSYALRRYDDDLRTGLSAVDKAIADIQGTCFGIFAGDEIYGRAYVLNRTLEALYGKAYGPKDPVREAFLNLCMHHDLTRPMGRDGSLTECIEWDKWRMTHKDTPQNRITLALRIAGRRFHYDHKFKDLMKAVKDCTPAVREDRLRKVFDQCKAAHDADEAESHDTYRKDAHLDEATVIHGYHAYDWLKKEVEDPEETRISESTDGQ